MFTLNWQGKTLQVKRLVVSLTQGNAFLESVLAQAKQAAVVVVDETAEPIAGDFWLGVLPRAGFGTLSPDTFGWACRHEVTIAAHLIYNAIKLPTRYRRTPRLDQEHGDVIGPVFLGSGNAAHPWPSRRN